jgi:hypothetical protein
MRFLFQAAVDTANLARNVMMGVLGQHAPIEGKTNRTHTRVIVEAYYAQRDERKGEQVYACGPMERLMEEYFKAHIPEALEYAVAKLEAQAQDALLGSEKELRDLLGQIEGIRDARTTPAA